MPWKIQATKGFSKYLKSLSAEELKRFKELVKSLENTQDPKTLGELKGNKKYGRCFVADVSSSCRLAYRINVSERTILLVRVGDHKEVYGKD